MTPAIQVLKKSGVHYRVHEYVHDPGVEAYGEEAVEALGLVADRVFKTLLAALSPSGLAVAVVPVPARLNLKALAAAAGAKRAALADPATAERVTGYVLGGISPLGQKRRLPTFIDESALAFDEVYISAGRRGLEISLAPVHLIELLHATTAALAR